MVDIETRWKAFLANPPDVEERVMPEDGDEPADKMLLLINRATF